MDDSVAKFLPNDISNPYSEVSCLYPWGWATQNPHKENSVVKCGSKCNSSWHLLRHAAMVAIDKAAARDRQLFPCSGSAEDPSNSGDSFQHSSHSPQLKHQKVKISKNGDSSLRDLHDNLIPSDELRPYNNLIPSDELWSYLCTGFDIYLVWEPCTLCAMALVHQRIHCIFYAFPNPNAGVLGSIHRLQGENSLNHHCSVFRILVPKKTLREELNEFSNSSLLD